MLILAPLAILGFGLSAFRYGGLTSAELRAVTDDVYLSIGDVPLSVPLIMTSRHYSGWAVDMSRNEVRQTREARDAFVACPQSSTAPLVLTKQSVTLNIDFGEEVQPRGRATRATYCTGFRLTVLQMECSRGFLRWSSPGVFTLYDERFPYVQRGEQTTVSVFDPEAEGGVGAWRQGPGRVQVEADHLREMEIGTDAVARRCSPYSVNSTLCINAIRIDGPMIAIWSDVGNEASHDQDRLRQHGQMVQHIVALLRTDRVEGLHVLERLCSTSIGNELIEGRFEAACAELSFAQSDQHR